MFRTIIIVFILNSLYLSVYSQAITTERVDSLSYQYYLEGKWENLIELQTQASQNGIDFKYLHQRTAYAYFVLGDYFSAQLHYEKAYRLDPLDPISIEYLYYCNLYRGDYENALWWTRKMSTDKFIELSVEDVRVIDAFDAEYNYKWNDADTRSSSNFIRLGVNSIFSSYVSLYQNYSSFNQTVDSDKIKQKEYYGILSITANPFLKLRVGYHGLFLNISKYNTSSHMAIAAVHARINRVFLESNASVVSGSNSVYQYGITGGYQFKGHGEVRLNLGISALTEDGKTEPMFTQSLGFKVTRFLWNESFVISGNLKNFTTFDGMYVYNGIDRTKIRVGTTLFWVISPKIKLITNYSFDKKEISDTKDKYNLSSLSFGLRFRM